MKQSFFHNEPGFSGLRCTGLHKFSSFALIISLSILPVFSKSAAAANTESALCEPKYISPFWFDGVGDLDFYNGEAVVSRGGKWGLVNLKGEWVIEPQFESLYPFSSVGLAPAEVNGKTGYINPEGEWVIEPQFEYGTVFADTGLAMVQKNGKAGVIDTTGYYVLKPEFDEMYFPSKNNYVYLTGPVLANRGGQWSIVTIRDMFTPPNLQKELPLDLNIHIMGGFDNGLAPAEQNGKIGLVNPKGEWVIEPQFENIGSFANGLATVLLDEKFGFIDKEGHIVIPFQFDAVFDFWKGMAEVKTDGKWNLIDTAGRFVLPYALDGFNGRFGEAGLLAAAQKDKWGFINRKGEWIIPPQFETAYSFQNGMARVKTNGKWGLVNPKGEWVTAPVFDFIRSAGNGVLRVRTGEKYNFIKEPLSASCSAKQPLN